MKKLRYLLPVFGVILIVAACTQEYATPTADEYLCVYDGSERGGQKLKIQLGPGEQSRKIDDNDFVVKIPANNRFFFASLDDNLRDPNAPHFYETFAAKNVSVQIQGQARFRFRDNACEWFSKHGRRNAIDGKDMQFNARGGDAANSPWLRWLAENFGPTMQQAFNQVTSQYDAYALTFHYPTNSDESGLVADGQTPAEPTDVALGRTVGPVFTKLLLSNLGGEFFCGIDPNPADANDTCPDITFQVTAVHTSDPSLEQGRQSVEKTKQDLINAQLKGELERQQNDALAASAAAHQAILAQQLEDKRKQNEIDDQNCLARADRGLDCQGNRPPVIVNGSSN